MQLLKTYTRTRNPNGRIHAGAKAAFKWKSRAYLIGLRTLVLRPFISAVADSDYIQEQYRIKL